MQRNKVRRIAGLMGVLLIGLVSFAWGCAEGAPDQARAEPTAQASDDAEMDAMKAMLVDAFERAKAWDLEFAEAVPEKLLDWAPSDDVRGFADQIVHAANNGFVADFLFGVEAPEFSVAEGSVTDKAALIAAVSSGYDWILEQLNAMPSASLAEEVDFFGGTIPRWRVGTFAIEHAMWTRGQLVPYLHANGLEVPPNHLR